jgi:DNA-binding transcriptional LysR family regulator
MENIVSSEDLELVRTIARTGSVGAAARRLQITQPSASQRLGRLERRAGLVLFDRDTQGARPTPAGAELARQAEHILGHLTAVLDAARQAGGQQVRRMGTIPSLAERVLPIVDAGLAGVVVDQVVDHGHHLVDWLDEGTLDGAVLAIADQMDLPRSIRRHRLGTDELVLVLPRGVPGPSGGGRPLRGRAVVFSTYDASGDAVQRRLVDLGAVPTRAATVQTALGVARRRSIPAVVPRSICLPGPRERMVDLPWRHRMVLHLLVPRRADPAVVAVGATLRRELVLAR